LARLGGQLKRERGSDDEGEKKRVPAALTTEAAAALLGASAPSRPPSKLTPATRVEDARAGGAALPRKGRSARDRQERQAAKGQRATGEWKSEAFMALRQQYD
jgi:hypothetical protein